jgi:hypothetical protein
MDEAVSRGFPATEDRVQPQASTFGSYDVVLLFSFVTPIPPEPNTHFTSAISPNDDCNPKRLAIHKYTLYSGRQHPDTTLLWGGGGGTRQAMCV